MMLDSDCINYGKIISYGQYWQLCHDNNVMLRSDQDILDSLPKVSIDIKVDNMYFTRIYDVRIILDAPPDLYIPMCCGAYFITTVFGNTYAGSTNDLCERISCHRCGTGRPGSKVDFEKISSIDIYITTCISDAELLEDFLIYKLNPTLNKCKGRFVNVDNNVNNKRWLIRTRIKELRIMYDLTQEELAKKVGVRRETIAFLEKGKYNPSLKLAYDVANTFKSKIEEVFIFR